MLSHLLRCCLVPNEVCFHQGQPVGSFNAWNVRKSFSEPPLLPDHPRYRQWLLTDTQLVATAPSWVDVIGWQKKKPQHERQQPPFPPRWHWFSCNAETGCSIDLWVASDHSRTPGNRWIWFLLFSFSLSVFCPPLSFGPWAGEANGWDKQHINNISPDGWLNPK